MESARRRISAWKIVGVAAVSVMALTVVAVYLFDWNMLRGPISRRVSAALGRPFAINGDLTVHLSFTPRVIARDVVLGNASWAAEPNMAEIGVLDFTVDAMSLLRRRIVLPGITVSDARVWLEKSAEGAPNWDFGQPGSSSWGTPQLQGMTIDRGHVEFVDPGAKTNLTVDASTKERASADEPYRLQVAARGRFLGMSSRLDGEVGSLLELRNKGVPYPIKLRGTVGATRASVDGILVDPMSFGGEDVRFELAGADLAHLLPIIGVPLLPTPPYRLAGHLDRKGKVWTFRGFSGTVGASDLA